MSSVARPLLVGIGNTLRGDDGVGPYIVRSLQRSSLQRVDCLLLEENVSALIERLGDTPQAYVFDALLSGAAPGTVRRIDALHEALPEELSPSSTHSFCLADVIRLAELVGNLPAKLVVFGIEAKTLRLGAALSAPVQAAAARLVHDVTEEIEALRLS